MSIKTTLRQMLRKVGIEDTAIKIVVVSKLRKGATEADRVRWENEFGCLGIEPGSLYNVRFYPALHGRPIQKLLDTPVMNDYGSPCFPPFVIYCDDHIVSVGEYDGACGLAVVHKDPFDQLREQFYYA